MFAKNENNLKRENQMNNNSNMFQIFKEDGFINRFLD